MGAGDHTRIEMFPVFSEPGAGHRLLVAPRVSEHDQLHHVVLPAAAAAESLQSCPTLCSPIDGSPPGSAIPGILQAGTLEWVAVSFSTHGHTPKMSYLIATM